MKSQKHNDGKLKEMTVKIEEGVVEAIEAMSKNSGISVDELVVIALKRFRAHHADYEGTTPITE
jgi:fructose-1,6-bisphosphatase/sedoheptulose 1,7-bisphosphatase-like protein